MQGVASEWSGRYLNCFWGGVLSGENCVSGVRCRVC